MSIFYKLVSSLTFIAVLAYVLVYALSEYRLRSVDTPPIFKYQLIEDQATLDHGHHLLRTRGCFGCHGQQLQGRVFTDQWEWVDTAVAPNLPAYAKLHDIATIERAIRHGIGADGKAFWSMPSYNFARLNDSDVGAIISYLRSVEAHEVDLPEPDLGLIARWKIATGSEQHMADYTKSVPPLKMDIEHQPAMARGEYLAMTSCNECHGLNLRGEQIIEGAPPDLAIVGAYSRADFRRLMKHGIGLGGREDLGLMTMVAKDRFASFTEQEVNDLYNFLGQLVEQTKAPTSTLQKP